MTKTIYIIILFIVVLYTGNTKITFDPFSFKMETWHRALAFLLFLLSFTIYDTFESAYHYKKGLKDGINYVVKEKEEVDKE